MKNYYLVYTGLQKYRDGSIRKRERVVRLGKFSARPKITGITIDKPTGRGIVEIEYRKRMPSAQVSSTRIPATDYYRGNTRIHRSSYRRGNYTRSAYYVMKTRGVTLGDLVSASSARITSNPPRKPLMEY